MNISNKSDSARYVDPLVIELNRGVRLLEHVGEATWKARLESVLSGLHGAPTRATAREVLTWFGGPDSFNELFISAANGHRVHVSEEGCWNNDLDRVRERIFGAACDVMHQKKA